MTKAELVEKMAKQSKRLEKKFRIKFIYPTIRVVHQTNDCYD
jgi:hypothetical protein